MLVFIYEVSRVEFFEVEWNEESVQIGRLSCDLRLLDQKLAF